MKLTKENIQIIDSFLNEKKIKHLDIRVELLDHLATEFEEHSNYVLIEDFLLSKLPFIIEFDKKQKKTIHWSYQKQLWVQFAKFFYQTKFIMLLFVLGFLGYLVLSFFSLKIFSITSFTLLIVLILYPLYYQIRYAKAVKKVQSLQSLFTITSLPSVFLYSFTLVKDTLFESPLLLIIYYAFSILLGLSAVIIIENERKKILEKYYQLVNNT